MRNIAVAGAGLSGLSAALRLAGAGARVTLYERTERVGGALRSDEVEGVVVDCGVQLLSSTYVRFLGLAREVGVGDRLRRASGRDGLWRGGRVHALTYGSAASLATSSALPPLLKLKVAGKYLPYLATRCRHLDANDPLGTGGLSHDGESIARWGEAELGRSFVELMAYPFLAAYYGAVPEETSAAFYHALARVGLDVKLLGLAGGMGVLGAAAAARLREGGTSIELGRSVEALNWTSDSVTVRADGEERGYDGVVLALPAEECRRLLATEAALAMWLGGVRTVTGTSLSLVLSKRLRVGCFGIAVPRTEPAGAVLAAACVESEKIAGLVPEDRDVLVAFPAPAIAAELAESPAPAVVDRLVPALESLFGRLSPYVLAAKVHRHRPGYTQFGPGYLRHLSRLDPGLIPSRIALAGDWLVAPTVEGATASGERAAARLLAAR